MWFKNARLFRFTKSFEASPERLEEKLADAAFKPCGSHDTMRLGWVPPLGRMSEQFVHAANGYYLICLRKEEKLLPAQVVKEAVMERVEQIELEQSRKVRRKERDEIREQLTLEMLPQAFTRSRHCYAYIAPKDGWMVVDASSPKQAEEVTSHLRKTLGSLPVRPPAVEQSPAFTMTGWLNNQVAMPSGLVAGLECDLKDPGEEGGTIKCKGVDLHSEEVLNHLACGMRVTRIALNWEGDQLSFVLDEDLALRRLTYGNTLREQLDEIDSDDALARFDGAFSIMTLELARLIPVLLDGFGGEDRSSIVD